MAHYKDAIQSTLATVTTRAANHRNLVVCIVAAIAMTIAVYIFSDRSIWAFHCLLLSIPVSSLFFLKDHQLVEKWREQILAYWQDDEIDIQILEKTVLHLPDLPEATIKEMFNTFLFKEHLDPKTSLSAESRYILVKLNELSHSEISFRLFIRLFTIYLTFTIIAQTLNTGTWTLLLLVLPLLASPVLLNARLNLRIKQLAKKISCLQVKPDTSFESFTSVLRTIRYPYLNQSHYKKLLGSLPGD